MVDAGKALDCPRRPAAPAMADLNIQTLFGQESAGDVVPWPHGHGSRPPQEERTLFGEPALWRTVPWPWGHGSA